MTRRVAFTVVWVLCGIRGVRADEALPKAETILDRFVEVTGGKAAYEKRKNEIATGTVEFMAQGVKGTMTRYSAEPDKAIRCWKSKASAKSKTAPSGGVAWEKSADARVRVFKSGEEKAQALREAPSTRS